MVPREPDLPRDPAEYRPRPPMGVGFWALMAFGVLCVLAGAGVAVFGSRLLPAKPVASAVQPARPTVVLAPVAPASSSLEEVAGLRARIAVLESEGARSSEAAAAALAVAELVDASQGSRPFERELAALRVATPSLPELAALGRLAEVGAPSRAALAASFPPYAARAARRARKPAADAGFGQHLVYAAAKVVTVRRIDETTGSGADALLTRAEVALRDGEVVAALKALDGLPPSSREALAPWRAGAERRAEIDREVAALRQRAVRALAPPEPAA